jgi:uncharacterized metal-binding protein
MTRVRVLAVAYACQGCERYGQKALEAARALERAGEAEAAWLGTPNLAPKARFPIWAIDGCAEGCALQWLARHGVTPDRHVVLP